MFRAKTPMRQQQDVFIGLKLNKHFNYSLYNNILGYKHYYHEYAWVVGYYFEHKGTNKPAHFASMKYCLL